MAREDHLTKPTLGYCANLSAKANESLSNSRPAHPILFAVIQIAVAVESSTQRIVNDGHITSPRGLSARVCTPRKFLCRAHYVDKFPTDDMCSTGPESD